MPEYGIKVAGWKLVAVLVGLLGLLCVRFMTVKDLLGDPGLVRKVKIQIMAKYFPGDAENAPAVHGPGGLAAGPGGVKPVATARVTIESLQASRPLMKFSRREEVVVKVVYSLVAADKTWQRGTKYYRFSHGVLNKVWQLKYETSALFYYLGLF